MSKNEIKPDLCVEIRRPIKNSTNDAFSSGYAFGSDLILTCSHGLFHENIAENADIDISWQNLGEHSADIVQVDDELNQKPKVIWVNKELDVAVIQCKCPFQNQLVSTKQIISNIKPDFDEIWESAGYLANMENIKAERKFMNPEGTLQIEHDKNSFFELWGKEKIVDKSTLWEGFSGSPVFVNNKIVGVVIAASDGTGGANLTATSIPGLLQKEDDNGAGTFAKVVGLDVSTLNERVQRQKDLLDQMCFLLKGRTIIIGAIRDSIEDLEEIPGNDTEHVENLINSFFKLADNSAIKCLAKASKKLEAANDKQILGKFVETWLPVIFENPKTLDEIRLKLDAVDSAPVDIPYFLAIPVELLMARLAGVNPSFTMLPNRKMGASFDIGAIHEVGLDSSGKQTRKVFNKAIKTRFSSINDLEKAIGDALDHTFQKENLTELRLDQIDENERIEVLKYKFEQLEEEHGRNFYFCCDLDNNTKENNHNTNGFIRIKKNYPTLLLIAKDNSNSAKEYLKYDRLYKIIADGKHSNV